MSYTLWSERRTFSRTYSERLPTYTAQLMAAVREVEDLTAQEIACWRMFGLTVEQVQDEVLVTVPTVST